MKPANEPKKALAALAIVRDGQRRAGWRVCRVAVVTMWADLGAAEVEENALRKTPHWLPFARLSTRGPRDLGEKFRTLLQHRPQPWEKPSAPDEAQSAAVATLAGPAGAEENLHWWQRD